MEYALMFDWPMSSPKMTRIFGFFAVAVGCDASLASAAAGGAPSARRADFRPPVWQQLDESQPYSTATPGRFPPALIPAPSRSLAKSQPAKPPTITATAADNLEPERITNTPGTTIERNERLIN
jgi:hypothetical protein